MGRHSTDGTRHMVGAHNAQLPHRVFTAGAQDGTGAARGGTAGALDGMGVIEGPCSNQGNE